MKLESVIKQIVSEAVTPVQFLMKAIKGLGKGAVEAENALIRAIRKEGNLGPKVAVDVNNVTEELMQRAVKNVEFAAYRKLIAQKLYNKNQQLLDDIILNSTGKTRVLQLNNAGIPSAFQEEVRNLSKLKNRTIKQTKTTTPKSPKPKNSQQIFDDLIRNSITDEEKFKNYLANELKEYSLPAMYKGKEQKYINEIWAIIDKQSKGTITKFNKTLKDLEMSLERLTYQDREKVLKKAIEGLQKSNKSMWDKFSQNFKFWSDPEYKSLSTVEKYTRTLKMSGYINLATAILDLTRLFLETENTEGLEWQGHLGLSAGPVMTMKVAAAATPRLNVFFSTLLFAESLLRNVYEYSGARKFFQGTSTKSKVLGDTPPSEDEVDFN